MSTRSALEVYGSLLRVPHASGEPLLVHTASVSNIYAGHLEGGPDARRLREQLAGRGQTAPVLVRWDPSIDMRSRSGDIIRRVPHWMVTAHVRFDVEGEGREAVVIWLSDGVRAVSLEELLREGLGDVDLTRHETPIVYGQAKSRGLSEVESGDGVRAHVAWGWSLHFGGSPHGSVEAGDVVVQGHLIGPVDETRVAPAGRSGRWRTQLPWRAVVTPGAAPFDEVVRAAARRIAWRAEALELFEDDD